jgi:hypothetical protein
VAKSGFQAVSLQTGSAAKSAFQAALLQADLVAKAGFAVQPSLRRKPQLGRLKCFVRTLRSGAESGSESQTSQLAKLHLEDFSLAHESTHDPAQMRLERGEKAVAQKAGFFVETEVRCSSAALPCPLGLRLCL